SRASPADLGRRGRAGDVGQTRIRLLHRQPDVLRRPRAAHLGPPGAAPGSGSADPGRGARAGQHEQTAAGGEQDRRGPVHPRAAQAPRRAAAPGLSQAVAAHPAVAGPRPGIRRPHLRAAGPARLHLQRRRHRRPLVASGRQWRPGGHTYPRPVASSPMEASTMTSTPTRQSAPTRSSLDIGRAAQLRSIEDVAAEMGIGPHLLEPYGTGVAKIDLGAIEELAQRPRTKYVVVSAITPTPLGGGKTTTNVGLGQGLNRTGRKTTIAIRQASPGPTLGSKGGAGGGKHGQIIPMERLNLLLTGDMHAVTAAHNQLSAILDNHLYRGNALNINPSSITWRRVLDVDDRVLRDIVVGLGPPANGLPRQTGFEITAASELMAALAMATSLRDLR